MMQEVAGNEISYVVDEIANIIKQSIGDNRKINLIVQKPDYSSSTALPAVMVYDAEFTAEEIGFGGELGEGRDEKQFVINGDGKTPTFRLPLDLIKPVVQIRTNDLVLENIDDYTVDYDESVVSFRSPPPKHENVYVRYVVRRDGEDKGMRLRIRCHVDLWAANSSDCNDMALKAIKQMLKATNDLQLKGIRLLPTVKGQNIAQSEAGLKKENVPPKSEAQGKRLVYLCETNFKVHKGPDYTRIKEIHIKEKK